MLIAFLLAAAIGAAFVTTGFGYTGAMRRFLLEGDGRDLAAGFAVPMAAALIVLPVGVLVDGYGRFVAPLGLPLVGGAAMFGMGMQMAGGCGSGTLVAAGRGSRRMWAALPFFCVGGVLGTILLPGALALPSLGVVDFGDLAGPWGGLACTEALLAAGALLVLRGARPDAARVRAGLLIGALAALLFLSTGEPWGITMGLTLFGAKAAQAAGMDLHGWGFWAEGWTRQALDGPVLDFTSALTDLGVLAGAFVGALATGQLRAGPALGWGGWLLAGTGGLLMGVGARLSFGCNIGAFVSGSASGSLHGLVWLAAALPGCRVGLVVTARVRGDGGAARGLSARPVREVGLVWRLMTQQCGWSSVLSQVRSRCWKVWRIVAIATAAAALLPRDRRGDIFDDGWREVYDVGAMISRWICTRTSAQETGSHHPHSAPGDLWLLRQ